MFDRTALKQRKNVMKSLIYRYFSFCSVLNWRRSYGAVKF